MNYFQRKTHLKLRDTVEGVVLRADFTISRFALLPVQP